MKSVGETMAIGRTFCEAIQKAIRGLENGRHGLGADGLDALLVHNIEAHMRCEWKEIVLRRLEKPDPNLIFFLRYALALDVPVETINSITGIDPWFLKQIQKLLDIERRFVHLARQAGDPLENEGFTDLLLEAKRLGFSDTQIACLLRLRPGIVGRFRESQGIHPSYRMVDTCAGEFEAVTPYFYSTYGEENEAVPLEGNSVAILGSGPNRIGQGIEFDYCCVQVALELRERGYRVIMINCNPETVSTDYDIADRLYFEPLTAEDVISICRIEKPSGVIVQFGGGTPLKLVADLEKAGIPIIGTGWEAINLAEDRGRFETILHQAGINTPEFGTASDVDRALDVAARIGYPVLVRPSYVLGGRAMEIIYDENRLRSFFFEAAEASDGDPVLIDRFLEDAFEFDVDAISDGENCLICGIMQHIEEAGIHSGDSACVLPPYMLTDEVRAEMIRITKYLANKLQIKGLLNLQFAYRDGILYVLELNPRASRTIPFVSKATGTSWARNAARILIGEKLSEMNLADDLVPDHVAVKAVKFPFARFDHISYFLGPEMRSTGEVMGISDTFGDAFARAQTAVRASLPKDGGVFISVNNNDKEKVVPIAHELNSLGFQIFATRGTHAKLTGSGIPSTMLFKVGEGRPNVLDEIKNGFVHMIINTPLGRDSHYDERAVGREAYLRGIPNITTLSGAWAAVNAIKSSRTHELTVRPIQEYIGALVMSH
jgi:carbamoyl-phosphate synthase large subunit